MRTLYIITVIISIIFFSCHKSDNSAPSQEGQGGSLARFTVSGDYLYTVEMGRLNVFNIQNDQEPNKVGDISIQWEVETIYAKPPYLFLGTRTGVKILSIENPAFPSFISDFEHVYNCDPVVVTDSIAYSTLNSTGACGRGLNQLDIIDISDIYNPKLINSVPMENAKGMGVNGNILFVCNNGLNMYDISNKQDPKLIAIKNIPAEDVIPLDTLLLVTAEDGMYQYSYNQNFDLEFLSKLFSIQQ